MNDLFTYKHPLIIYLIKFLGSFCFLYFGTKMIIGLSAPGGYYSPFVHNYLDYISVLRRSLLLGSRALLSLFGYHAVIENIYFLKVKNGHSIHIVYSCLGYGIFSFWLAFIFSNKGSIKKKLGWMMAGCMAIWAINITRISLLLLAVNSNWHFPFGLNHHTWFNIIAYAFILAGIYFYDRQKNITGNLQ